MDQHLHQLIRPDPFFTITDVVGPLYPRTARRQPLAPAPGNRTTA
jgi:hypothetical protein